MDLFADQYHKVGVSRNLAQIEKLREMSSQGHEVYNLAFGQSPFPVPDVCQSSLSKNAHSNLYEAVQGVKSLRDKIVNVHNYANDMSNECYNADTTIITPGCKEATWLLMHVLSKKVPVFLVSPTWVAYESQVKSSSKNLYWIDTKFEDNYKLTKNSLEQALKKAENEGNFHLNNDQVKMDFFGLVILVEPDNPSGRNHSDQELKDLAQVFRQNKLMVLSDEIYGFLSFDHKLISENTNERKISIAKYYPEGTIISSGFSKWASLGGWRIGYNIYPNTDTMKSILHRVKSAASFSYSCVTSPVQYACLDLLNDVFDNKNYGFLFKASVILCCVAEYTKNKLENVGIPCTDSTSGFYLTPDFEKLRASRNFKTGTNLTDALLAETGISMVENGPCFGRPVTELTTRLAYIELDGKEALLKFDGVLPGVNADVLRDMTPRQFLHEQMKKDQEQYRKFLSVVAPKMVICVDKLCDWVQKK